MVRCQRCCLAPGAAQAVISRRKTIRAVIIRTIIDGTTDMRESPDWIVLSMMAGDGCRLGPLLPGFFGEPVAAWVLHLQCGNKADLVAPEIIISAVRQNFVKVSPDALMNRECGISATCCWGAEGGARSDYPGGRGTQIGKCAHVGSLSLASPVAISTILRIEADPLSEGPVPLEGLRGLSDFIFDLRILTRRDACSDTLQHGAATNDQAPQTPPRSQPMAHDTNPTFSTGGVSEIKSP